jgi:hypothetical protein
VDAAGGTSDTINFDPSLAGATIVLTQGQLELSGTGSSTITIDGSGLSTQVEISGNNASRVFQVDGVAVATLSGLTIKNGQAGGACSGILNSGTLTVSSCTLADNSNGGIQNLSGTMVVSGCTLAGNFGPGIQNISGTMTVSGCNVTGNSFGGINNKSGSMAINGCTVADNYGAFDGGGIFNWNGGTMTVSGCSLLGNKAAASGGGIGNSGGAVMISDSTVAANLTGLGGAIFNYSGMMTVSACNLSGNVAVGVGGGIANYSSLTISNSTLSGNSSAGNEGVDFVIGGGGIYNMGAMTVQGCTLSGNSADSGTANGGYGGGIDNRGDMTVSGSTLFGNSAAVAGGGIYNNPEGSAEALTITTASTVGVYGVQTFDISSAVYGNQAPSGADLENVGVLTIDNSAVASLDDQNPGSTTMNVAATDTATALTASVDSTGQITFTVQVLAAQAGAGTPTGTVTLYDGNNNVLGTTPLTNGQAVFNAPSILSSASGIYAVYSNDGNSNFTGSTSAPLIQAVDALTPDNLQSMVPGLASSPATAVALSVTPSSEQDALNAVNGLTGLTGPVTIVLNLVGPGKYTSATASPPSGATLIINGVVTNTIVDPATPALIVTSGHVIVENVTFTESGDAPTILVSGGSLTLRNDVVQSSSNYSAPAVEITGGALDLGTAASPGGNTINVIGGGQAVLSTGPNLVTAVGDSFQANGAPASSPVATVVLVSSANPSLLNQPVTFTATVSAPNAASPAPTGNVTLLDPTTGTTLAVVPLSGGTAQWSPSALAPGAHSVAAVYSGDAHYITSSATLVQQVRYHFSGFLAPLHPNMTYAAGKTIPIKFQLTDYHGAYITSLGAVTSLQVVKGSGTDVLAGAGKTGLRYDPTANQFVYNWQTRGLADDIYAVLLVLNDGTTDTLTLTLSSKGAFQLADGATSGYDSSASNQVLYGTLSVAVEDDTGAGIDPNELNRISDAMSYLNSALGQFGVSLSWAAPGTAADVTIRFASSTPDGGAADGVLGFTTADNNVYLIEGWDFYTGSDPTQVGASQYDFQTLAEHELAHTVGLGESSDPGSVMYEYLAPGIARRTFTDANLTAINTDADRFMKVAPNAPRGGLEATVLTAAIPATSVALNPTNVAVSYGSVVSGDGVGTATTSVGSNGDAFGVANNSTLTLMDLLLAADSQAVNGALYGGNAAKRNEANAVFSAFNQDGDIS